MIGNGERDSPKPPCEARTYLDLTDGKGHAGEPDENGGVNGATQQDQADEDGEVRSEGLVSKKDGAEGNGGRQADGRVDQAVENSFKPFLPAHAKAPSLSLCLRSPWSWPCLRPHTRRLLLLLVIAQTLVGRIDHLHCPVLGAVYGEGSWRGCWSCCWSWLGHFLGFIKMCRRGLPPSRACTPLE